MFEQLQEKVSHEAQSNGSRSLLSILRRLTEMSQAELDAIIAFYEEHHTKSIEEGNVAPLNMGSFRFVSEERRQRPNEIETEKRSLRDEAEWIGKEATPDSTTWVTDSHKEDVAMNHRFKNADSS